MSAFLGMPNPAVSKTAGFGRLLCRRPAGLISAGSAGLAIFRIAERRKPAVFNRQGSAGLRFSLTQSLPPFSPLGNGGGGRVSAAAA
jgi:hypothetical protein